MIAFRFHQHLTSFMHVKGVPHTTIWYDDNKRCVFIIDQTLLPHRFEIVALNTLDEFCTAIRDMQVRGAPLIGVTAAYGLAMSLAQDASKKNEAHASEQLIATRPTAINLYWAISRVRQSLDNVPQNQRVIKAFSEAEKIRNEDITKCESIGKHGLEKLRELQKIQGPVNILTHCNAGWLATVDWGTALAPIYKAHQAGLDIHVWVDETRPRNQGASLTAWELQQQGVPHTVICDNTGGHLMQHGMIDICIVGSDRTTASGDVCNKIGTYLKAIAAKDNNVPFYVTLPVSTIDWSIDNGVREIPIEQRDPREVTHIQGVNELGEMIEVKLVENSPAANYAFDVTPARLVEGLITEHGIYPPDKKSLEQLKAMLAIR